MARWLLFIGLFFFFLLVRHRQGRSESQFRRKSEIKKRAQARGYVSAFHAVCLEAWAWVNVLHFPDACWQEAGPAWSTQAAKGSRA